ncbi:hypothetical protein AB1N83_002423 [Pleurotus pulmonarius]
MHRPCAFAVLPPTQAQPAEARSLRQGSQVTLLTVLVYNSNVTQQHRHTRTQGVQLGSAVNDLSRRSPHRCGVSCSDVTTTKGIVNIANESTAFSLPLETSTDKDGNQGT